jgi:hypothetical protein
MFTMMNHARLNVGVQGVAPADRAYQLAVDYAKNRVQGVAIGDRDKGTIIRHPDVRRMLMTMRALTEASRALCYVTSSSFDIAHHHTNEQVRRAANARGELLTPIAKAWSTEIAQEVTSLGVQVHGGMGFIEETGAAQFMRDARITTIYEGTTGIQGNDLIGRKLIRDKGLELGKIIAEIRLVQTQALSAGSEFAVIASSLLDATNALEGVVDWFLENYESNPQLPGAIAVNFLMALGTVTGGWLMAKAALVAKEKMAQDDEFYSVKIITARFYAEHIMPRAQGYLQALQNGADTTMALREDQF